jgi:hypothetical protein
MLSGEHNQSKQWAKERFSSFSNYKKSKYCVIAIKMMGQSNTELFY